MLASTEQRNKVRYRLSADAVFAWNGPFSKRLRAAGVTRDLNISGAFIFTRSCPPVGASLHLDVFLSPHTPSRGRSVLIQAEVTVIRVEHHAACEGFAAVTQDFTLFFDSNADDPFKVSAPVGELQLALAHE